MKTKTNRTFFIPLFGGNFCMLFAGQYFRCFGVKKSTLGLCIAIMLFVLTMMLNVVLTFFEYRTATGSYLFFDNRNLLPTVVESICIFYMASFVRLGPKTSRVISYVGVCTFGIYLISDIWIDVLKPFYQGLCNAMNPLPAVVIYELAVFLTGLLTVSLLRLIPGVKKFL